MNKQKTTSSIREISRQIKNLVDIENNIKNNISRKFAILDNLFVKGDYNNLCIICEKHEDEEHKDHCCFLPIKNIEKFIESDFDDKNVLLWLTNKGEDYQKNVALTSQGIKFTYYSKGFGYNDSRFDVISMIQFNTNILISGYMEEVLKNYDEIIIKAIEIMKEKIEKKKLELKGLKEVNNIVRMDKIVKALSE